MNPWRGASRLEFSVVLVVFSILAHLLFTRLIALEHDTERLEVDLMVRNINIGLKLAIGEHLMRGEEPRIAALVAANPLDFLGQKIAAPQGLPSVAGGSAAAWHFSPTDRILRYEPRQSEAFEGRTELRWQIVGHRDTLGRTVGLKLEALK